MWPSAVEQACWHPGGCDGLGLYQPVNGAMNDLDAFFDIAPLASDGSFADRGG
jgi:hypothetical protein